MENPNLSSEYSKFVKKIFEKHIKGFCNLNHLCVSLILPNHDLKMISPWPEAETHYFNQEVSKFDKCFDPIWYQNWPIYFWKDPNYGSKFQFIIMSLKEEVYNLNNGFYMVKKVEDCYVIFGCAFPSKDPRTQTIAINNLNKIDQAGNFLYELYSPIFELHTNYKLPKLQNDGLFKETLDAYNHHTLILKEDRTITAKRFPNQTLVTINNYLGE